MQFWFKSLNRAALRTLPWKVTAAPDITTELTLNLHDPVSITTVDRELHNADIYGRAVIQKPFVTKANAQQCII